MVAIGSIKTEQTKVAVGQVTEPACLWLAIESLYCVEATRCGTLVVFSKSLKGRIGFFYNRYISGAVLGTGETGMVALQQLLSAKTGMFAFRPSLGDEDKVLSQSLAIDLSELMSFRRSGGSERSPEEALHQLLTISVELPALRELPELDLENDTRMVSPIESLHSSQGLVDGESSNGQSEIRQLIPLLPTDDFSYLDWMSNDNDKEHEEQTPSAMGKVLLRALPAIVDPTPQLDSAQAESPEAAVIAYDRIINKERERVIRDLEHSMTRHLDGDNATNDESIDKLNMLSELLKSEQERVKKWTVADLDSIQVPSVPVPTRGVSAIHKAAGAETCSDLTDLRHRDSRSFIKAKGDSTLVEPEQNGFKLTKNQSIALAVVICGLVFFGVSYQMSSSELATCLREGRAHIKAQRWSSAVLAFSDAIRKDSNCAQAYFYRGIALEETDDVKGAESDFQSAKDHGISATDIAIVQAGFELRKEDWKKALEICDEAIASGNKTAAIYRLRANANLHLKDFKEAKLDSEKALDQCKDDPAEQAEILADLGFAKVQMKDFDGGTKDFEAALKAHPDQAAYMVQGDAYRQMKRYPEAIESYTHCIELEPLDYDAYVARGIAEGELHKNARAIRDFGRALEINPSGVEALIQRGSLQLKAGAIRFAMDDLQLAYDLNPNIDETRQKLAIAYSKAKREAPRGLQLTSVSVSKEPGSTGGGSAAPNRKLPSDPDQLVVMGYNALNSGDTDTAIQCLVQAVKQRPSNVNARRYLANAFEESGNYAAAASQFGALGSMGAMSVDDTIKYCDALEHSGNAARAVQVLSRALGTNQENIQLRVKLAEIYYAAGQNKMGNQVSEEGLAHATSLDDKRQLFSLMKNANGAARTGAAKPSGAGTSKIGTGTHG